MKQLNHVFGVKGETEAKEYLIKKGYSILETNYTTKIGEIDIIAKKDDFVVFVEVKNRSSNRFGMPREAVTPYKQNKIRKVALMYITKNHLTNSRLRFDCVEILDEKITHIENAF